MIASIWFHFIATMAVSLVALATSLWASAHFWLAYARNDDATLPEPQRAPPNRTKRRLATAMLLTIVATIFLNECLQTLKVLGRSLSSTSASKHQLHGIEGGLFLYRQSESEPPDSLWRVVERDIWDRQFLIAPMDPIRASPSGLSPDYASYVFFPPAPAYYDEPRPDGVILAFERGAWHQQDARILGEKCRVVFIQYAAEVLDESDFAKALETDRIRRRELGWPVYEWNEKTGVVSQLE